MVGLEGGRQGDGEDVRPALEMRNVTKRFPGVLANDRVGMRVMPGEIHALLSEGEIDAAGADHDDR